MTDSNRRRILPRRARHVDADIDEELRFHLEMRQRDYLAAGLSGAAATDAARDRFGSVDEVTRQLREHDLHKLRTERRIEMLHDIGQDVKYAVRKLVKQPGFTAAVVAVLALGIGATTAIFSAVDAALIRPLPFAEPDRLVTLEEVGLPYRSDGKERRFPKSQPDITDVQAMPTIFDRVAAYAPGGLNLTGGCRTSDCEPRRVRIAAVTPGFFGTFGVFPARGRGFAPEEGAPGAGDVVVLSHALWQGYFAGDPAIVGKTIALNGRPFRVVGVMPKRFTFPSKSDLWIPLSVPTTSRTFDAFRSFLPSRTVARLAPGATAAAAQLRLRAEFTRYGVSEEKAKQYGMDLTELAKPLQGTLVKNRRSALLILLGATVLVLLIACANVTNLLLERASARQREIAVRAALGASRSRILRQLLTESVILSFAGSVVGVAIAFASLKGLTVLMPVSIVDVAPPQLDLRVLGFTGGLALATGLVFGLWPAFGAAQTDAADVIKGAGGRGATSGASRVRRAFVVAEVALALMLLVGSGLMLRSFRAILATDPGVQPDHVATMELTLPRSKYAGSAAVWGFYSAVLDRLRQAPGIEAAAAVNELPLRGEWGIGLSLQIEGRPPRDPANDKEEPMFAQYLRVTPDFFRTLGVRVLDGRALVPTDDSLQPVAVINETMAKRAWPRERSVGKRFAFGTRPGTPPKYITVIGVVADVRTKALDEEPTAQMYLPFADGPSDFGAIVVRGRSTPNAMMTALRESVRAVDPGQPTYNLRMMNDVIASAIAPRRTNTMLISIFGGVAVLLAALGVYAVIAYGVTQRTREIGIRVALGAQQRDVVGLVLREGLWLAAIGIAIGLAGAWMLSRVLRTLMYGVGVRDSVTFIAAPIVLLAIAVIAMLVPARSATRVNPLEAIRAE